MHERVNNIYDDVMLTLFHRQQTTLIGETFAIFTNFKRIHETSIFHHSWKIFQQKLL